MASYNTAPSIDNILVSPIAGLPAARSEISAPNFYKISRQFQDIFVGFTKLKTQKMHIFLSS